VQLLCEVVHVELRAVEYSQAAQSRLE
jgi:hypothetical protein